MVKALRFKGEKKVKKRKRTTENEADDAGEGSSKKVVSERKLAEGEEEEGWVDSEDLGTYMPPFLAYCGWMDGWRGSIDV